jgi:hypothetical protein
MANTVHNTLRRSVIKDNLIRNHIEYAARLLTSKTTSATMYSQGLCLVQTLTLSTKVKTEMKAPVTISWHIRIPYTFRINPRRTCLRRIFVWNYFEMLKKLFGLSVFKFQPKHRGHLVIGLVLPEHHLNEGNSFSKL